MWGWNRSQPSSIRRKASRTPIQQQIHKISGAWKRDFLSDNVGFMIRFAFEHYWDQRPFSDDVKHSLCVRSLTYSSPQLRTSGWRRSKLSSFWRHCTAGPKRLHASFRYPSFDQWRVGNWQTRSIFDEIPRQSIKVSMIYSSAYDAACGCSPASPHNFIAEEKGELQKLIINLDATVCGRFSPNIRP